jgi:hypothetical protein
MTAFSPVLTTAPTTGVGVAAHNHPGQPVPTSATVAKEQRIPNRASVQNKQLSSRAFSLGMSSGGVIRVGDPASRSWSPVRLSGARACCPAGALSTAVRKDLNLNLSAVHENVRGRAYGPSILETSLE